MVSLNRRHVAAAPLIELVSLRKRLGLDWFGVPDEPARFDVTSEQVTAVVPAIDGDGRLGMLRAVVNGPD